MAATTLSFEAILAGECGPIEAEAAKRWLDAGAPLYEPPSVLGMVYLEEGQQGLDMTIHRGQSGQRRRRTSGHGQLLASPAKPPAPRLPSPAIASKRPIPASSTQTAPGQQRQQPSAAAAAAPAVQQPGGTPAATASMQQQNLHGQTSSLQQGHAVGAAAQPQGRSPAGAKPAADLGLGPGWQVRPASGGKAAAAQTPSPPQPVAKKQQGHGQGKLGGAKQQRQGTAQAIPVAAAGAQHAEQAQQGQQQQYISPEGLAFPSLQAVREVVQEGPILPPRKLIRYLRAAAANPLAAAAAAGSTRGLAHLLGLRRVRIVRIEEERQKLKRRLGQAGGGAAAAVPPSDRQLRRRS